MCCYVRVSAIAVLGLLCACGGGGSSGAVTTIPQANPAGNGPASNARSVQLGLQPTLTELPVVAQITGTMLFPAVQMPATVTLSASATAPAGVALQSERRAKSGTLTVYEYFTIVPATSVTLPDIPAVTLHFPSSTSLAAKSMYYGISDLNAQGGLVSFDTQGPGTISGQTVSFAQVPTPITYLAGHKYTYVVYATAVTPTVGATKIYITVGNTIATYNADGSQTTPLITAGLNNPSGVAVDAAGKIYVANAGTFDGHDGSVTTYDADGTRTTPTITALDTPGGIAVDAAGKIYVTLLQTDSQGTGAIRTYNADGTPSIRINDSNGALDVAVNAAGKIYVTNSSGGGNFTYSNVTTYNPNGTPSTPTTFDDMGRPLGVAIDATGKVYVADQTGVTTWNAGGTETTPTITAGLHGPYGVAVDAAGKIYVTNTETNVDMVTTYEADGTQTTPTIFPGGYPYGIAVH